MTTGDSHYDDMHKALCRAERQRDRLAGSLRIFFSLLDDRVLVRNIERDSDAAHFLRQGVCITNAIAEARAALDALDK